MYSPLLDNTSSKRSSKHAWSHSYRL